MHKYFLIVALAALPLAGAWAQTTPALPAAPTPPTAAVAAAQRAAPDSADAVRTLFRKRRNGGTAFTAVGSLVLLRGVLFGGGSGASIGASAIVAAPFLGIGIGKLVRFGSKKEEEYVKAYRQGKPLPHSIRKRLRPDYFRLPR
ncbi:hypothetical protein F0P96_11060 [Hymenobacter busanensis]|uniref:Uncharacterized protein n=1 Tax=Hymenobacter busanensis TaxID=2607656 RepID=A0A7L4ZVX9_9BACT|nr:hypothetical protein [Hymenobacter busanensis]KAA9332024.1 hypothetical protein F0P96_11060 [Hymenobacter busanensis]QHJ07639.1 hypothetical protein GUY19_10215 [Hymenobacter busanensis]